MKAKMRTRAQNIPAVSGSAKTVFSRHRQAEEEQPAAQRHIRRQQERADLR
jgi:hypothetical protein